ncbi:MAG: DUF2249 domain-containing protein [Planctomycetes bacterium]|nr:DUF2249 domain-containing protein [Planctomycetota bacterium]MBL7008225.1 DUF2249 domain-containing protein [Planctomycetota bacterium]
MTSPEIPAELLGAGFRRQRSLDVRPIVSRGEDPFTLIMAAADSLDRDEVLHLAVSFDPLPLYTVLGGRGFQSLTRRAGQLYHLWFYPASAELGRQASA